MTWQEKMKEWGGGDVSFLSEDGECITFVVVGEPFLIEGKFKGQDTERIGAPIVTVDGFSLFIIGKRIARRLSKHEKHFKEWAFDLVRRGPPNDTNTSYDLSRCNLPDLEEILLADAAKGVSSEEIADAVKAAQEIAV